MTPSFPLIGLGGPSDGIPSLLPTGNTLQAPAPAQATTPSIFDAAKKAAGQALASGIPGVNFLSSIFGGSSGYQYLTGILGLILIVAGIFMFRPVRDTVINVGKKGAALAA